MFDFVVVELPSGSESYQRGLSRSVSHPSHRTLFTNSRDHRQRDSRLVSQSVSQLLFFLLVIASISI